MKEVEYIVLAEPGNVGSIHVAQVWMPYAQAVRRNNFVSMRPVAEFGRVCALDPQTALTLAVQRFGPTVENAK